MMNITNLNSTSWKNITYLNDKVMTIEIYEYTYNYYTVALSLLGAFTSTYTNSSLVNITKLTKEKGSAFRCLLSYSIGLPITVVWYMHFICLFALRFKSTAVKLQFNIVVTLISFVLAVIFNILGFSIALIPYINHHYENYLQTDQTELFLEYIDKQKLVLKDYLLMILGSVFIGTSYMSLHIIGMYSLVFNGQIVIDWDVMIGEVFISIVLSNYIYIFFFVNLQLAWKIFLSFLFCCAILFTHVLGATFSYFSRSKTDIVNPFENWSDAIVTIDEAAIVVIITAQVTAFLLREVKGYYENNTEKVVLSSKSFVDELAMENLGKIINYIEQSHSIDYKLERVLTILNDLFQSGISLEEANQYLSEIFRITSHSLNSSPVTKIENKSEFCLVPGLDLDVKSQDNLSVRSLKSVHYLTDGKEMTNKANLIQTKSILILKDALTNEPVSFKSNKDDEIIQLQVKNEVLSFKIQQNEQDNPILQKLRVGLKSESDREPEPESSSK